MKAYETKENARIVIGEKTISNQGKKKKCFSAFSIHFMDNKLYIRLDCQFLNFAFSHDVKYRILDIKGSREMKSLADSALEFLEAAKLFNLKVHIIEGKKMTYF